MPRAHLFFLVLPIVFAGCAKQEYVGDGAFNSFALSDTTAPFISTNLADLYLVEDRLLFPLREPTQEQMQVLFAGASGLNLPFPRLPYAQRGDYRVEINFVVYNLDDAPHEMALVLNGINEFNEYDPGVIIDRNRIIPEFASWERFFVLEPYERVSGTVREEELDEVAVDLATIANYGATIDPAVYPNTPPLNPNQVVYFANNSATDVRSIPYIPAVIPALTGVRMGIRTLEAANIVVEYTVRITDLEKLIVNPDNAWVYPDPVLLQPSSIFTFVP